MNTSIQKIFEKLEQQRMHLLEQLTDLTDEKYYASDLGKWSISQIVAHLLTSEALSIGYMKKKVLGIKTLANSGLKQMILSVVLTLSQRGPFRFNAPKIVVANMPQALSLEEAVAKWDALRDELKSFLETIPDKHSKKLIYKHPVAGMLNVTQALKFMYEHVNHHLPQIKRHLNR